MRWILQQNLFLILYTSNLHLSLSWNSSPTSRRQHSRSYGKADENRQQFLAQVGITFVGLSGLPLKGAAAPPKKVPPYVQERGSLEAGLGPCPGQPMKKSCWSSEDTEGRRVERWEPPSSIKGDAIAIAKELEATMATYPQEGQNDVDRGGWKQAERNTKGNATYLRYEFTSGKFKYIDELELLVDASGKVSVRTASRSAGFDYNVNATRLNYIQKALEMKGWKVKMVS